MWCWWSCEWVALGCGWWTAGRVGGELVVGGGSLRHAFFQPWACTDVLGQIHTVTFVFLEPILQQTHAHCCSSSPAHPTNTHTHFSYPSHHEDRHDMCQLWGPASDFERNISINVLTELCQTQCFWHLYAKSSNGFSGIAAQCVCVRVCVCVFV